MPNQGTFKRPLNESSGLCKEKPHLQMSNGVDVIVKGCGSLLFSAKQLSKVSVQE